MQLPPFHKVYRNKQVTFSTVFFFPLNKNKAQFYCQKQSKRCLKICFVHSNSGYCLSFTHRKKFDASLDANANKRVTDKTSLVRKSNALILHVRFFC